ncbi:hypothetical protein ACH4SP_40715 [Streptomyces sp. NPDC021093]|uniref:hypothetical protein n=1 Tax=Streptomyces sp. NPDC021093 TaxID=3365112 RepID=UPI0037AE4386
MDVTSPTRPAPPGPTPPNKPTTWHPAAHKPQLQTRSQTQTQRSLSSRASRATLARTGAESFRAGSPALLALGSCGAGALLMGLARRRH